MKKHILKTFGQHLSVFVIAVLLFTSVAHAHLLPEQTTYNTTYFTPLYDNEDGKAIKK